LGLSADRGRAAEAQPARLARPRAHAPTLSSSLRDPGEAFRRPGEARTYRRRFNTDPLTPVES
jgi:hypothetical protein